MTVKTEWSVEHACGHSQDHDLSEKRASRRAGYARWLATKDCSACWHRAQGRQQGSDQQAWLTERRSQQMEQITSWEVRADMPCLDGSDKAVEWARRVRFELLRAAYELLDAEEAYITEVEQPARLITSASWWIDQRDADAGDVSELIVDQAGDPLASTGSENPF
ncbi:hypothetical protein [Ferrimicrobium sp.]|uniref:hypothetical protein n=1 Tax=Ferrimicrobium sp. TaxID=2926050 RepID=UPI00263766CB|nr:hypothetical protein [Ferrimicrobium sp.]